MRRILISLSAVAAFLATPLLATAEEAAAASADTAASSSSAESSSSSSASSGSSDMSGGMRDGGGLFDTADSHSQHAISAFLITPYDKGFGLGLALRYTLPIVPGGFIPKLNDDLSLELGADFSYSWWGTFGVTYGYLNLVIPAVEARWSFHFTRRWEAYGKVGVGFQYRHFTNYNYRYSAVDYLYFNAAVGGLMHLSDLLAIRAEIGYGGLRVGVGLSF